MSTDEESLAAQLKALELENVALRARERVNQEVAESASRRLVFLSEASALLAQSLDYETTLSTVAKLAIPFLGDSCVLHLIDPDGTIRYVEQVHVVPTKAEMVRQLRRRYPLTWETDHPMVDVLRSGRPYLNNTAVPRIRKHVAHDSEASAIIDFLGFHSVLIVPLKVRGIVRGALSLIISESERQYDEQDLLFAEEIANRAAQAIENARIYGEAQEAIRRKDELLDELRQTQQQLLHSQRLESLGRLAAGVAHDFNNLLTVIGGYADLVTLDTNLSEVQLAGLEQIVQAVERAGALTRQLLALSRKQPSAPRLIDAGQVVWGLQKLLQQLLGETISLTIHCADALWTIYADPQQLEQVLINLAANARDAMPEGGSLTIRAENIQLERSSIDTWVHIPPGDYFCLSVQDTGHGIPTNIQPKIFEPFFTTKEQGKGIGLGLAICYGIVQQHNGYLTLESTVGVGTTFLIYLPRVEGEPELMSRSDNTLRTTAHNQIILVVEDEPAVRNLVAHILGEQGYTVLFAEHGLAALEILAANQSSPPDLIISDVKMPYMSGPQLVQQLQARGQLPKVLFISGYTDNQLSAEDLRSLGGALIYKPFVPHRLLQAVQQLLRS
jgi:signal transduction histidine kinase/CheY-like chemotaxis protein